jgi:hypothetical protein
VEDGPKLRHQTTAMAGPPAQGGQNLSLEGA